MALDAGYLPPDQFHRDGERSARWESTSRNNPGSADLWQQQEEPQVEMLDDLKGIDTEHGYSNLNRYLCTFHVGPGLGCSSGRRESPWGGRVDCVSGTAARVDVDDSMF